MQPDFKLKINLKKSRFEPLRVTCSMCFAKFSVMIVLCSVRTTGNLKNVDLY